MNRLDRILEANNKRISNLETLQNGYEKRLIEVINNKCVEVDYEKKILDLAKHINEISCRIFELTEMQNVL